MKTQPIDRTKVNQQSASATDIPKSGFDLSYNSYSDFILGRLHVSGYQHTMPADKISFDNLGDFTLNRMVTPMIGDIEVSQHNFYVNLRSIDRSFEDAFAPAEHNGMNATWRTPTASLRKMVTKWLIDTLGFSLTSTLPVSGGSSAIGGTVLTNIRSFFLAHLPVPSTNPPIYQTFNSRYMADIYEDIYNNAYMYMRSLSATSTGDEALYALLNMFLLPLFGENSLLDSLGYLYLRKNDLLRIISYGPSTIGDIISFIDDTPQCEYALRAYYAVWYEYYRDTNLEPVGSNLVNWKDFSSTSVFDLYPCWVFLPVRVRSWQADMFVSSSPDDIMRHVFAPIFNEYDSSVKQVSPGANSHNYEYATSDLTNTLEQHNLASYNLSYRDPVSGAYSTIVCPIPSLVRDTISTADGSLSLQVFGLDLFNLRQSQMLERYLKRNFYFGDEYRDRMVAHYGSVVSDYSVRRPVLLSSSLQTINQSQEIAPVNTPTSAVGDRTVTAIASSKGDGAEYFCEEFGIILHLISFMPRSQYAGVCPQNFLSKQVDFPIPEFAAHNEELGRVFEIAASGLDSPDQLMTFGHYPYAHAYRSRVDEVHGSFLSDKQAYTFRRLFGLGASVDAPQLNYMFIHCHPTLDMFADTSVFAGQLYGRVSHNCFVERVLPTPVEII